MTGVLLVIVIGVIALLIAFYFAHLRREMWREAAEKYGMTYSEHDRYGIPSRFRQFALFQRGSSRKAHHCLEGQYGGRSVLLFDYRYTTGSGKNRTTHQHSAVLVDVDIHCPYLVIRPESLFDKLGDFLGFDDIDFEFEEFNRRFHVKGDKKFAYDICHSRMIDYLLDHGSLTWELANDKLLLYGLGSFDAAEIAYCLEASRRFLDLTPDYLRRD